MKQDKQTKVGYLYVCTYGGRGAGAEDPEEVTVCPLPSLLSLVGRSYIFVFHTLSLRAEQRYSLLYSTSTYVYCTYLGTVQ